VWAAGGGRPDNDGIKGGDENIGILKHSCAHAFGTFGVGDCPMDRHAFGYSMYIMDAMF
jgi:hypothetical protein